MIDIDLCQLACYVYKSLTRDDDMPIVCSFPRLRVARKFPRYVASYVDNVCNV